MKKNTLAFLTLLCCILLGTSLKAQEIIFSYDNAGNMVSRAKITSPPPVEDADTTLNPDNTDGSGENTDEVFNDKLGNNDIKIYPNPTTGKLSVEIPTLEENAKGHIDILDMQGILKQRIRPLQTHNTIILDAYPAATYILLIEINGEAIEWKIIKQ